MKIHRVLSILSVSSVLASPSHAVVRVPAIFSDHMVLQRGVKLPVWGRADAGENVKIEIAGRSAEATADAGGRWRADLPTLDAQGPHTMTISGSNHIEIKDVLVGEVWLGSGQSNMAMAVKSAKDFEKERAAAALPLIRMFKVENSNAVTAQEDCKGAWTVCAPETVGLFSATAFFFGREIHAATKVPVGLINSSVGGTPIESWIDKAAQESAPELREVFTAVKLAPVDEAAVKAKFDADLAAWKVAARQARKDGKAVPRAPRNPLDVRARKANVGGLFNGMIAPLIPFAIRGALWYQGEANSTPEKARFYQHQLPLLITDWRKRWGHEFPFAWVQLPNFGGPGRDWPTVREGMAKTLSLPQTGMAITIDIGDTKNIHPTNKQDVGRRLAAWALASVYGDNSIIASGPLMSTHEIRGGEIVVSFSYAAGGLRAKDGAELTAFQIAGEDKQWHPAKARIAGETIVISAEGVSKPVAARYAWENDPKASLLGPSGIPAAPFRTDAW